MEERLSQSIPALPKSWRLSGGRLAAFSICLITLIPLIVVVSNLLAPAEDVWAHVLTLLPALLLNTFWLVLGVAIGTVVLGTGLAWLTAVCDFPGRRFFDWALVLPLALPGYVLGFILIGLLDFSGPVQTLLRDLFGSSQWFPRIRSRGGVILALSLTLYPYVYLLARNAFQTQGSRALEAARSLGENQWGGFFRVALPMARPWIAAGLLLALMETLADFGTVSIFNYETFTTAIYKAWFGLFSLPAAAQLASFLLLFAFALLVLEQRQRARQCFTMPLRSNGGKKKIHLQGWRALCAALFAGAVLALGFIIPVVQLVLWSVEVFQGDFDQRFFAYFMHSMVLASGGALLTVSAALLLSYIKRLFKDDKTALMVRLATLGYALPGTVLAVGVFIPVAWLDNILIETVKALFGMELSPLLSGSLIALLIAYMIRFMAVGFGAVESAMQRITLSMEEAARSLGVYGMELVRRIHLPLLRGGLYSGLLLVFVDIMKEMPITLMMRPFGWDSLAVRVFEMTSEGEWKRAALPAVILVLAGLLPILLLTRGAEYKKS